jgi:hypothetical protein
LCDRATAASQAYLEANGYRVSRDCNNDVLLNIDGVFKEHAQHNNCYPTPNPSPQGSEFKHGLENSLRDFNKLFGISQEPSSADCI